jgi:hypothetical protein
MAQPLPLVRRAVTDLLSVSSLPLELAGAFVLWHYGSLFSSNQELSRDYRAIIAQIMPNDSWGFCARGLAMVLATVCLSGWLTRTPHYNVRTALSGFGLFVWGVLIYSCWRTDVPFSIYRLYCFYFAVQVFVALLLRFHKRTQRGLLVEVGD